MGKDSPAREPSWSALWLQKPSVLRVCVREEDAGGREAGAHSITLTYIQREKICEGAELVGVVVAETIHPACMCEGGGRGGEGGERAIGPDNAVTLENGRADKRVNRGLASERAVCVSEAAFEKGARRPPLPAAVVCPPGGRRRRRLAITAWFLGFCLGQERVLLTGG